MKEDFSSVDIASCYLTLPELEPADDAIGKVEDALKSILGKSGYEASRSLVAISLSSFGSKKQFGPGCSLLSKTSCR